MPKAICHTSLQYLHQLDLLGIFPALAEQVIVAPAVLDLPGLVCSSSPRRRLCSDVFPAHSYTQISVVVFEHKAETKAENGTTGRLSKKGFLAVHPQPEQTRDVLSGLVLLAVTPMFAVA